MPNGNHRKVTLQPLAGEPAYSRAPIAREPRVTRKVPVTRAPLYDGGPSIEDIYAGARRTAGELDQDMGTAVRNIHGWIEGYKSDLAKPPLSQTPEFQAAARQVQRSMGSGSPFVIDLRPGPAIGKVGEAVGKGLEFWRKTLTGR